MARTFLFDTSTLVDFCCPSSERPHHNEVAKLAAQCLMHDDVIAISMGSLIDVYYLMKTMGRSHQDGLKALAHVMAVFSVQELVPRYALSALSSDEPRLEAALVRAMAEDLKVDAIITDDHDAFATCAIPHLTASECLQKYWPECK